MAGLKGLCLAACILQGSIVASNAIQQPLVASTVEKPLVDSEALQAAISSDKLLTRAKDLFEVAQLSQDEYNRPTRVIGSAGHLGTLKYIQEAIGKLGDYYKTIVQPFPAYTGGVTEYRLVLGSEVSKSAAPMGLTPATKDQEPVTGDLVLVDDDGCDAKNYPSEVEGNIAFVRRGTCPFGDKSSHAGKAGALAVVIYNNEKGRLSGTLGPPTPGDDHVAAFGIDLDEAEPLIAELKDGKSVDATAYIQGGVVTVLTQNIVIQTAEGDPDNCIMVGAHSDSVDEGPGINDDGSGTLSLLEVATALTKFRVNNCVRFGWWAAEEEGLLGSNYYASTLSDEENLKVRLFADYDMMASPNFAYQIYNASNVDSPTGSEELKNLYVDWYEAHDLNYTFIPFDGRSDYDGFIRAGIPAGGIATGAEGVKTKEEAEQFGGKAGAWYDPCYHQLCDDVGNNNLTAWEVNTKLIAHSVATYGASFKGFPERKPADLFAASEVSDQYAQNVKYRGSRLFW